MLFLIMYIDGKNMKSVLELFPDHCKEAMKLGKDIKSEKTHENAVICGMGGSAISGDLIKNMFPDVEIPIFVIRDYKIPAELIEKDEKRKRLLIAPWVIDKIKDKKLRLALVEEYPTYDCLNITTEFL